MHLYGDISSIYVAPDDSFLLVTCLDQVGLKQYILLRNDIHNITDYGKVDKVLSNCRSICKIPKENLRLYKNKGKSLPNKYYPQLKTFFEKGADASKFCSIACFTDDMLGNHKSLVIDTTNSWSLLKISSTDNKNLVNTCVLVTGDNQVFVLGKGSEVCDGIFDYFYKDGCHVISLGAKGKSYKRYIIQDIGFQHICLREETYRGFE